MKIERKTSFVVAGIEFDDLKVAQFFQRAMNRMNLDNGKDARELLDTWAAATHEECGDAELAEIVMRLQLPKPARKKNPQAFQRRDFKTFPKKKVQALAGDLLNLGPAPGEQEEVSDGLDTTFALKA